MSQNGAKIVIDEEEKSNVDSSDEPIFILLKKFVDVMHKQDAKLNKLKHQNARGILKQHAMKIQLNHVCQVNKKLDNMTIEQEATMTNLEVENCQLKERIEDLENDKEESAAEYLLLFNKHKLTINCVKELVNGISLLTKSVKSKKKNDDIESVAKLTELIFQEYTKKYFECDNP